MMYWNRADRGKGKGALKQMFVQNRRMITNLSAMDKGPTTGNGRYSQRTEWRRNPGPLRSFRTQSYQFPAKSTKLKGQCFDLGAKSRYPSEYAQTNGTYENHKNSRGQCFESGLESNYSIKYAQLNGIYKNSQISREQCSESDAKTDYSTEYSQINGTYKNSHYIPTIRENTKNAPYHVPVSRQNRGQERRYYTVETQPEYAKETRTQEIPKPEFRKVWKTKIQPKNNCEIAPVQPADIEPKSISNFISPSPWFSGAETAKSNHQKDEPDYQWLSAPRYNNTFDKSINKPEALQSTIEREWNTSNYATKTSDNDINHSDNLYSKELVKSRWVIPPELNLSIETGKFFAKVCEAVLEKVLQQLRPNSFNGNQIPGVKTFSIPEYSKRDDDPKKNMLNGSSLYSNFKIPNVIENTAVQNEVPQPPRYADYNKSRFIGDCKRYVPKPIFRQPRDNRNFGRIGKRKILMKNGKSLIYV